MEHSPSSSNTKNSISLSRNHPTAIVIGAAGFIGSHICAQLIAKDIQVIAVDDLSTGKLQNLKNLVEMDKISFIHQSITAKDFYESLPQLPIDYLFINLGEGVDAEQITAIEKLLFYIAETQNNIRATHHGKTKVVLLSTIDLYNHQLDEKMHRFRTLEVTFAKQIKALELNGRVVRLSAVFGENMHFNVEDPLIDLLKHFSEGRLDQFENAVHFNSRAIYIDDAIHLIFKSVMLSSTNGQIFDGARKDPIRIDDLKAFLSSLQNHNPFHNELRFLEHAPTPNLEKSFKELSWHISDNFKDQIHKTVTALGTQPTIENESVAVAEAPVLENVEEKISESLAEVVSQKEKIAEQLSKWSFKQPGEVSSVEKAEKASEQDFAFEKISKREGSWIKKFGSALLLFMAGLIILYALLTPILTLVLSPIILSSNMNNALQSYQEGDLKAVKHHLYWSEYLLTESERSITDIKFLTDSGVLQMEFEQSSVLVNTLQTSISGVGDLVLVKEKCQRGEGSERLISHLNLSRQKLESGQSRLSDQSFISTLPGFISPHLSSIKESLEALSEITKKGSGAAEVADVCTNI